MKKIILSFVGTVIISAVFGVSTMLNDPKVEQPKEQLKQETKIEKVDEITDTEEKAVENQDNEKEKKEVSSETEKTEKKETDSKSINKSSSSVSNVPKQETTTKKESKSNSSNANTTQPAPSNSQNNQQSSEQNNQQNSKPQTNSSEQKNNVSTAFYDSITGGKKDRKKNGTPMTESECFALGTQIQNKELDYVLDYNEQHPEAPIQPDINYFRIYPVIDDEGTGYYLHFFCVSGEGNDAKLKSMYGNGS